MFSFVKFKKENALGGLCKTHIKMKNVPLFIMIALYVALIFGEVRCIYKAVTCDWNPIGKAEIIYTAGAFTGLGVVIGYMDIKD